MKYLSLICGMYFMLHSATAQVTIDWNANLDVELSKGGEDSHFYYNGINEDKNDWRVSLAQFNLYGIVHFSPQWKLNARLIMERDKNGSFNKFLPGQFNLEWSTKSKGFSVQLGRFINPYGIVNPRQISTDRTFIERPLYYSYYSSLSDKVGLWPQLKETRFADVDNTTDWGLTNIYYQGYADGLLLNFNLIPDKMNWQVALTSNAPASPQSFSSPLNFGAITRLEYQPTYFWKQGLSASYGTFNRSVDLEQIEPEFKFSQLLIGTDFSISYSYFELSGEINSGFYKVPFFVGPDTTFLQTISGTQRSFNVGNINGFADLKCELPFLSGAWIAYRFDMINFSKNEVAPFGTFEWDDDITRHTIAVGYKITSWLLFRTSYSLQNINNRDLDQDAFRATLTFHY